MTSLGPGGPRTPAGPVGREAKPADDGSRPSLLPGNPRTPAGPVGREARPADDGSLPSLIPGNPQTPAEAVGREAGSPGDGVRAGPAVPTAGDSPRVPDSDSAAQPAPDAPPETSSRARRPAWAAWWSRRYLRWGVAGAAVLVAVSLVAVVTIDLGPAVRARAEQALGGYLERDVSIGRIGIRLLRGRFVVEDLTIGGLHPDDRPFLMAEQITLSVVWPALLHGEFLADAVFMRNWQMLAESFPDGRQSFPAFVRQSDPETAAGAPVELAAGEGEPVRPDPAEPDAEAGRRFVTTLQYLNASRGQFRFEDHGSNWSVSLPDLDLTITKVLDYRGHAASSGGILRIGDFEPMGIGLETDFLLDGADVRLTRIDLETDGTTTRLQGDVDMGNFPEMSYTLESDIDFTRMREIFFARDNFTASGLGHFSGTFHKFEGGHDLRGTFTSGVAGIDPVRFPALAGDLVWRHDRFEVSGEVAPYGGEAEFDFSMAPLGGAEPGQATFDVRYAGIGLGPLARALEVRGIQPVARASGRNRLDWPLGGFADFRSEGGIRLDPSAGVQLAGADPGPGAAAAVAGRREQPTDLTTRTFRFGGQFEYRATSEGLELGTGYLATPSTRIAFGGRTAWGADTRIPFEVASSNWQESDRLMAAVMTAVGAPTDPFAVDGYGTLDGVLLGDLASPRIEATFAGEAVRAWNVEWGAGRGEFLVENAYLDVIGGDFRRGDSALRVDGQFSLARPRNDGGEEMNALVQLESFPAASIRAAFGLREGYLIDGPATGEMRLYGAYRRLFGVGRLRLDRPTAYGEPFDSAAADLRFEGTGVRLNRLDIRKGAGSARGAAFIEWDASYSFNLDARGIDVGSLEFLPALPRPPSGTIAGTASGVGVLDNPRYVVRATISDLHIGDEEVGHITGQLDIRDGEVRLDLEGASSTVAFSAAGRVSLGGAQDADLSLRVADWSLDPWVRMFVPEWSPYTKAVLSGSLNVVGELRNWDRLDATATIQRVDLSLLDYGIRNEGPIRLTLDRRVIGIDQFRLAGVGTALDLSGVVDLASDEVSVGVDGNANLDILQGMFQSLRGSGSAVVDAEVAGTVRQPVLTGQAAVRDGRIRHISLPHALEEINGRIIFERGAIRFDEMVASMGSGPVQLGGRAGVDGFELGELGITASGRDMQLRFPQGFRSNVDTDLVLRGPPGGPILAGTVSVHDAVLLEGLDAAGGLFGGGDTAGGDARVDEPGLPLSFDVRIDAPSSLRIDNNLARIVSSAELTLQGTYDRPVLLGTVELERGTAFFEGNRYRLNHGTIGFANLNRIEPFVDVEVETDVRVPGQTYRVMVRATGTPDELVPALSSDPPLPEVDVLSLLLGDIRDPQSADLRAARAPELAQQQRFQAGAARLLTSPLSSSVGRVVQDSFGVDTFQITPSLGDPSSHQSAQLNPTARMLIGKRISDRTHVTLSRAISGANRDLIVVIEHDQSDRLTWILSQNEDRTYALDFRMRHAF